MQRIDTLLPDVCLLEPKIFRDNRGYFFESYQRDKFIQLGIKEEFVQDNRSYSTKGVLRGLHYQIQHPQAKLCTVLSGEVFDVVVDIRRNSPYFGKWIGVNLSAANKRYIYIPAGCAHGFLVLSESAEFSYKCSDFYYPGDEGGILWNDPDLAIDWPIAAPILSTKDLNSPLFSALK